MMRILQFQLLFCLLMGTYPVNAQFNSTQKAYSTLVNLLVNPGAELGKSGVTIAGGDTFSVTTTAANVGTGSAAFSWNSAGAARTLTSNAVAIPVGLYGKNGAMSCNIQTPSGTATHTINAFDGTNLLSTATVTSSTNYARTTINFPFPATGNIQLRLSSVAADEPQIYIDDCIIADANLINLGLASIATDWTTFTPTGTWSTNTTYTGKWRRIGDTLEVQSYIALAGAPTTAALSVNLPTGFVIDTSKFADTSSEVLVGTGLVIDSGALNYAAEAAYIGTTTSVRVRVSPDAGSGYVNRMYSSVTQALPITFGASDSLSIYYSVPIVGWTSNGLNYRPEQLNWYVDATMDGANPDLGASDQASYVEIINAGLTLHPKTGSAAVGTMCSTTNAATAPSTGDTTCAAGSESVGINFTIPTAGAYQACFYGTHYTNTGASGEAPVYFQLIETPTNAQTLTLEGGSVTGSGNHTASTQKLASVNNCSIFNWTSSGTKGVRLMYEQDVTATVTNNLLLADLSAGNGQRNMRWTVRPWTGNAAAPVLVGGVTSPQNTAGSTIINNVVSKSGNYTATASDETIVFTADATLTLPAAAGSNTGKKYIVISSGSGTDVTIDGNASETICGSVTITVNGDKDEVTIQSDGTNWRGVSNSCFRSIGAKINCDAGSTYSVPVPSDVITSVSNNATGCTTTWHTGIFSVTPMCTFFQDYTGGDYILYANATSAASFKAIGRTVGVGAVDYDAYMNCFGMR